MNTLIDPTDVKHRTLEFYDEHAEQYCRDTFDVDMNRGRAKFLELVPQGGRILDAGCGSGRDSAAFQAAGYRVTAIDASPEMVRNARLRGVPAKNKSFQDIDEVGVYDGIWACASLLHVPRIEIVGVLLRLKRALRCQGILYVTLKYGTGESLAPDGRFFSYYTPQDFSEALRAAGLKLTRHWISGESPSAKPMWVTYLALRPKLPE